MTESIEWREDNGHMLLEIKQGGWSGKIALVGAQVLSWKSDQDEGTEMIWTKSTPPPSTGKDWIGGIPIVFPWFGLAADDSLPPRAMQHGFARNLPWRFESTSSSDGETEINFSLSDSPVTRVFWNHSFRVELMMRLRPSFISQEITVHNTGDKKSENSQFSFEMLFHPYIKLGSIASARVRGLDGAANYDKVSDSESEQEGDIEFPGPVDRVNHHEGTEYLVLENEKPVFRVTKEGSTQTVVWNPGPTGPWGTTEAAPDFVCVEPGCVYSEGRLTIHPGQSRTMKMSIQRI